MLVRPVLLFIDKRQGDAANSVRHGIIAPRIGCVLTLWFSNQLKLLFFTDVVLNKDRRSIFRTVKRVQLKYRGSD